MTHILAEGEGTTGAWRPSPDFVTVGEDTCTVLSSIWRKDSCKTKLHTLGAVLAPLLWAGSFGVVCTAT